MLETRKAYEYALDRIGLDIHSVGLWHEYINYMQLPRPNTPAYRALWASGAAPGQEDAHRVMTLRSMFFKHLYCCPCGQLLMFTLQLMCTLNVAVSLGNSASYLWFLPARSADSYHCHQLPCIHNLWRAWCSLERLETAWKA